VQQHLHLADEALQRLRVRIVRQPEVGVAADHALRRGGRQCRERLVRQVPARRRAPGEQPALALEQRAQCVEEGARLGRVEAERVGVAHRQVLAADLPVHRAQQPPGQVAGVQPVGGGSARRPGQGAVRALPAERGGKRAFVRHRQGVGVAAAARRERQAREQRAQRR